MSIILHVDLQFISLRFMLLQEGVTEGRTDGPTDSPFYRDARAHLKTRGDEKKLCAFSIVSIISFLLFLSGLEKKGF